jgi:hypothetical protein
MTMDDTTPDATSDVTDEADIDEAQAMAALAEARERLAEVPVETMITNHAMGMWELAAIHLSAEPPDLTSAALAIDAFAAVIETLGERIGPEYDTLTAALSNIRMAFVQVRASAPASGDA